MRRTTTSKLFLGRTSIRLVAAACAALLLPFPALLGQAPPPAQAGKADAKLTAEKLDALVAPVALFPDQLLGQILVASTYPLEIVQLQQWLMKNKGLKDKALADAVAKQPWDPSIQGMAVVPDVVKRLADDIGWTTELGNAFLGQQAETMDAVQRMRKKAQGTGALATNQQQKVETQVVESKTVIIVQQTNPEVIYVPSYNPTVVYGPPPAYYPYPPIYYPPPPPPGSAFVAFTAGVIVASAIHGGWGYGCGWNNGSVNVNVNNNYVKNNNINTGNINKGNSSWNHNPQHRGGTPYANSATAGKYSGGGAGGAANRPAGTSSGSAGSRAAAGGGAGASPAASTRSSGGGGGGDQVGSRNVSPSSGGSSSAFSGSKGSSGASAAASSSRGASSMSSASRSSGGGGGRRR